MKLIFLVRLAKVFLFLQLIQRNIVVTGAEQPCPSEFSTLLNSSQKVRWPSSAENVIVVSEPPCLDEFNNLITRSCSNGTWTPNDPPACTHTDESTRRCPWNFQEYQTFCIFITEPKRWDGDCNRNTVGWPSSSLLTNELNESVWLPFRRTSKYGSFESVTWGDSFGTTIDETLNVRIQSDYGAEEDCLVLNTKTEAVEPANCDSLHKQICFYSKEEVYNCPKRCVNAGINSLECYCKSESKCERLAEIRTVFQKNILSDLAGDDLCLVEGSRSLEGYSQALDKNRWLYTRERIDCELCLLELDTIGFDEQVVYMLLNFEEKKKELYLVIYNPEGLFNNAAENTVYCFTNADSYKLTKRMAVTQVEEHSSIEISYKVYQIEMDTLIGQYWCSAYRKFDSEEIVRSNKVTGYLEKLGNEYALRVIVNGVCQRLNCSGEVTFDFQNFLPGIELTVRVMEIYFFDAETLDVLLHLSSPRPEPVNIEFHSLRNLLKTALGDAEIVHFRSSEFCLAEWARNGGADEPMFWPLTQIGHTTLPKRSCLQDDGLPVFRLCEGSFMYGAEWSGVVGNCDDGMKLPQSVTNLQSVLNKTITDSVIDEVTEIIKGESDLSVLSIYYVAKVLDSIFHAQETTKFSSTVVDEIGGTLDIADSLLNVEKKSLSVAQDLLNITDDILDRIDEILSRVRTDSDVLVIGRENVALHITNPYSSNVSGVVVSYDEERRVINMDNMRRNETFEDVAFEDNFKLAYYIPESILDRLMDENITVITTVFFNDRLFVSNSSKKPAGMVLSITIPDHGIYLPGSIPILFKSHDDDEIPQCGFWDYGKNYARKKGRWSTLGGSYLGHFENETAFHICSFSHLTHFALLILETNNFIAFDYDYILSLITYIGDFLSVCGIVGIFLTAVMFKKWRQKQGTIILLNLSVAIVLEIVLTQNIEMSAKLSTDCVVFGKIIHYIVISKFSWMLIYSFLQYMRFVKVFNVLPDRIVSISVIFGWGFAVIPVGIVAAADPLCYVMKKHNFCYPSGLSLYLGLIMPIMIIIFINTFVFFAIIREVTAKTVESHGGNRDKVHKLQMQLAALLFFVLGVPWLFGIFSNVIPIAWIQTSLVYLFCITTNVQGFILFLFYVVFNGETKTFWLKYFSKKESTQISMNTKTTSRS